MDFKLSYEQEAIQKAAEEFAKGEFDKDIALEHEKAHTFPHEILKRHANWVLWAFITPKNTAARNMVYWKILLWRRPFAARIRDWVLL